MLSRETFSEFAHPVVCEDCKVQQPEDIGPGEPCVSCCRPLNADNLFREIVRRMSGEERDRLWDRLRSPKRRT